MSGVTLVRTRCVVLMGKSGAGKSTVANMLVGHDPMSEDPPFGVSNKVLASVTREVSHEMIEFYHGNILYRVTVIDTVGLFDTEAEGNDIIFKKIEEYFKQHIDGINLILFVFKKNRFTKEEREVFSFIRNKFDQEISPISALAVTACEQDDADARKDFVEEFRSDPTSRDIARQMQKGIYPVGFPPLQKMKPALLPVYKESMDEDRETLMNLIIQSKDARLTRTLFEEKVKPVIQLVYLRKACTIL